MLAFEAARRNDASPRMRPGLTTDDDGDDSCTWCSHLMWNLINCFRNKDQEHVLDRHQAAAVRATTYHAPIMRPSPLHAASDASCNDECDHGALLPKCGVQAPYAGPQGPSSSDASCLQQLPCSSLAAPPRGALPLPTWGASDGGSGGGGGGRSGGNAVPGDLLGLASASGSGSSSCDHVGGIGDGAAADEDDVCPTCLEPYDPQQNPRVWTRCGHHFHMQCIYEWLERKATCPLCDRHMDTEQGLLL